MIYLPNALNVRELQILCNKYFIEIAHKNLSFCKDVWVRYVEKEGKFGYTQFGTFFFEYGQMYILRKWDEYDDKNDANAAFLDNFGHLIGKDSELAWNDCEAVQFAGIRTVNKNINGEWIYTGDIVECVDDSITWGGVAAAPGDFPKEWGPVYAIIGDNHCTHLRDAGKTRRIGTIFYQINKETDEYFIESKSCALHTQGCLSKDEVMNMAIYTPSFVQEEWKYLANKELGIEPTWNK